MLKGVARHLPGQYAGLVLRGRGRAAVVTAVEQAGMGQVRPHRAGFLPAVDAPVLVAADAGRAAAVGVHFRADGAARQRRRHIARYLPVAVDKTVIRGLDAGILVRHVAHPGAADQLLAFQDAAQQESDQDQDDGDFHQGKTRLVAYFHNVILRFRLKAGYCRVAVPPVCFSGTAVHCHYLPVGRLPAGRR